MDWIIKTFKLDDGRFESEVWAMFDDCPVSVHTTKPFKREQTAEQHANKWAESDAGREAMRVEEYLRTGE